MSSPPTADNLDRIHCVDSSRAVDLDGIELIVAGDVTGPLLGLTGAAGGLGFAASLLGATTASGADYVLDLLDFDRLVADVDLVITGEGRLDNQTLKGKLPAAVALRAAPTPVVAVVGRNDLDEGTATGFTDTDTSRDPQHTAELLQHIGIQIGNCYSRLPEMR
jgi:glycerate 2-kinase